MDITVNQTPYFYKEKDLLLQALDVYLKQMKINEIVDVEVLFHNHTRKVRHEVPFEDGTLRILLPCPVKGRNETAVVNIKSGNGHISTEIPVGGFRPWTIYVAQDKHLDYGWKHSVEEVMQRINCLTDYYMDQNEERGIRFNMDCMLWFDEYKRARPLKRLEKLAELLKKGEFQIGALTSVMFNGILTEEELIHSLLPAYRLGSELGIRIDTIMPNEVPGMNWGMVPVLSGAGIKYIVRGAYDFNNSNLKNREPYPLFWWEGPDGSRVLTKFDLFEGTDMLGGYAEGRPLRIGSYEERIRFIEKTISQYENYKRYDFDAILLAGTGWDEYPFTTETAMFIDWFNSQGWDYPRIVDSTWADYFKHIEADSKAMKTIPVYKGDYGVGWDEWPAQLAYMNAQYRKARGKVLASETASALSYILTGELNASRQTAIHECYLSLCRFADHNIGGIGPYEAYDTRDRKTAWVYHAMKQGSEALEQSVYEIIESISCEKGSHLVLNTLSWERSGCVEIILMDELGEPGEYCVTDTFSGEKLNCQLLTKGIQPEHYLVIFVKDIPAFGYKVIKVEKVGQGVHHVQCGKPEDFIENDHFRLQVDMKTGAIISLFDKKLQREWADDVAAYKLNQYVYTSQGRINTCKNVKIHAGPSGAVSKSLIVESKAYRSSLRTTYTIYEGSHDVDIENFLVKKPSNELQSCHFAFPFKVPDREYHYDGTAAILRPGLIEEGGDQLPGSGMSSYCGLHFADASNDDFGVTLCSPDTHLYQFGSNTMGNSGGHIDSTNSEIYSVAMENYNTNDHCLKQGNQDVFYFHYRIAPHCGKFVPKNALHAGMDASRPLMSFPMGREKKAGLNTGAGQFIDIKGEGIITSGLKVSEDGKGLVIRLRNCIGTDARAVICINERRIRQAAVTDLMERDMLPVAVDQGEINVNVPAKGILSVRLVIG